MVLEDRQDIGLCYGSGTKMSLQDLPRAVNNKLLGRRIQLTVKLYVKDAPGGIPHWLTPDGPSIVFVPFWLWPWK